METYILYYSFGKLKMTKQQNYSAYILNEGQVVDMSSFKDAQSAKQWLIDNWKLLESQIKIIE